MAFSAVRDGQTVTLMIAGPLFEMLADLSESGPSPARTPNAVVTVSGDDPLDRLEAEFASSSAHAALEDLLHTQDTHVGNLIGQFRLVGADIFAVDASVAQVESFVAWVNRHYVARRSAELTDSGQDATPGASEILPELAELLGEPLEVPDMGTETMLLAAVAEIASQALVLG